MICCEDCHRKEVSKQSFDGFIAAKIVLAGKNSIPIKSIEDMKSLTLVYDMPRKLLMRCIEKLGKFFDVTMPQDLPNIIEIKERIVIPND
ncbi:hypothetical protein D3C72_2317650 [compost metagenome]